MYYCRFCKTFFYKPLHQEYGLGEYDEACPICLQIQKIVDGKWVYAVSVDQLLLTSI